MTAVALAASCTTEAPAPNDAAVDLPEQVASELTCGDPRPQVCTTIYAPVCAEHGNGRRETLASACNACAVDTVSVYTKGPCEASP